MSWIFDSELGRGSAKGLSVSSEADFDHSLDGAEFEGGLGNVNNSVGENGLTDMGEYPSRVIPWWENEEELRLL